MEQNNHVVKVVWFITGYHIFKFRPEKDEVLNLFKKKKIQYLKNLLLSPSPEGQAYAYDALLRLEKLGQFDFGDSDKELVRSLFKENKVTRTCGHAGSYKIYETRFKDIFTRSWQDEIHEFYLQEERWSLRKQLDFQ